MFELSHMYADNGADGQLVRAPKQFGRGIVTATCSAISFRLRANVDRSLGMLPSASLGAPNADERPTGALRTRPRLRARYAGQGKANPIACILQLCHGAALFL